MAVESEPVLTGDTARQRLYDLMQTEASFEEKVRKALELGTEYLDVENGHLTRINEAAGYWEAVASTDGPNGTFPPGLQLDLSTTYCRRVLDSGETVALADAPNEGWADDPAFETHGLHCYHGTEITVNGSVYGTLCFVANEPRADPFTERERMYVALLAKLIEHELEYDRFETQVTRRTNLAVVLNRVLWHNLRNDMSVVRGYTQAMANRLGDDTMAETPLRKIDNLLDLADKARKLGHIVTTDVDSETVDIASLLNSEINQISDVYSGASFVYETEGDLTTAVLPCFQQALHELIENAAEHGGETSYVSVTGTAIGPDIVIDIADDGPGLPDHEAAVFESGTETPLIHGSGLGLWLAYWIVMIHGGTIEATTDTDGTTVTITIPRTTQLYQASKQHDRFCWQDEYKRCFQQAGEGMTITNDDARIIDINMKAARIIGKDRQNLIGRSIKEFLPGDLDFAAEWGDIQATDITRDTLPILSADGGVKSIEYTAKTDFVPGYHLIISQNIEKD
jgi:PAS domain S-box-containing protein